VRAIVACSSVPPGPPRWIGDLGRTA
jgi:hypothetical protein